MGTALGQYEVQGHCRACGAPIYMLSMTEWEEEDPPQAKKTCQCIVLLPPINLRDWFPGDKSTQPGTAEPWTPDRDYRTTC